MAEIEGVVVSVGEEKSSHGVSRRGASGGSRALSRSGHEPTQRHALICTSSMFQPDMGAPPKAMTAL